MSPVPFNLIPDVPWKSQWRKDFERQRAAEQRTAPEPPTVRVCAFTSDGLRCTQRIHPGNQTGLCAWHNGQPRKNISSRYRRREPKMVPPAVHGND